MYLHNDLISSNVPWDDDECRHRKRFHLVAWLDFIFFFVVSGKSTKFTLYHSVSINKFIYTISVAETLFTFIAWMVTLNWSRIRFLFPSRRVIFLDSAYLFPAMGQSMAFDSNLSISLPFWKFASNAFILWTKCIRLKWLCAEPLKYVLSDGRRRHKSFETFHLRLVRMWWIFDNDEDLHNRNNQRVSCDSFWKMFLSCAVLATI